MNTSAYITLGVLVVMVVVLARERYPPAAVVLGAVVVLLVAGVIEPTEAFAGFANEAPFIVAGLYVLAGAATATGALGMLGEWLGRDQGERRNLARMLGITAGLSSVVNNTTVVATMAPAVADWTRHRRLSAARYLMPVSFASLLGGLTTAIGTSTNVTVSSLLVGAGLAPLGFFEITRVGLPIALAGVVVLVVTAPRLMPRNRHDPLEDTERRVREFTVEMTVTAPLAGRTVEASGLRNLAGVYLVEISRAGSEIAPAGPGEVLADGDQLTFVGDADQVIDLHRIRGLRSAEERHFEAGGNGTGDRFYEAVVGADSSLVGTTLKAVGFRGRYGAAVVGIHRAGAPVREKLGEVVLHAGDVLVVLADRGFQARWKGRSDFLVIAARGGTSPLRTGKAIWVYLVGALVVVCAGTGILSLLETAVAAAFALVLGGVISPAEARDSIDLDVVVLIAASFGLGNAVAASGLAAVLGNVVVAGLGWLGPVGVLAGVFVATAVLTGLISNNAAAVLMFSIAMTTAAELGVDPRPFVIAVAVAASTDFLTPVGYQTNTMVLGMGGYRFFDFARVGFPLTLTTALLGVVLIPLIWPIA